jgi:hypothetical protein
VASPGVAAFAGAPAKSGTTACAALLKATMMIANDGVQRILILLG